MGKRKYLVIAGVVIVGVALVGASFRLYKQHQQQNQQKILKDLCDKDEVGKKIQSDKTVLSDSSKHKKLSEIVASIKQKEGYRTSALCMYPVVVDAISQGNPENAQKELNTLKNIKNATLVYGKQFGKEVRNLDELQAQIDYLNKRVKAAKENAKIALPGI